MKKSLFIGLASGVVLFLLLHFVIPGVMEYDVSGNIAQLLVPLNVGLSIVLATIVTCTCLILEKLHEIKMIVK